MSDEIEIVNLTNMSLDISDIGIKLPGRGSKRIVPVVTADASGILREFKQKRWVSCKPHRRSRNMPHWPFHKVQAPPPRASDMALVNPQIPPSPRLPTFSDSLPTNPSPPPFRTDDGTLGEIRDLLKALVDKPNSSATPEVIAAHVATQLARMTGVRAPGAVHVGGLIDDAPQFIPERIIPEKAELSIKKKEVQVDKSNFDDAATALRAMKKQKDS